MNPLRYVGVVSAHATDRRTAIFRCVVKSVFNEQVELPQQLLQSAAVAV